MPEVLLDMPKAAKAGEIVAVKVLIAHPMETGYRREISGAVIPRDIIRDFVCNYDGREVFRAEFHPAIAANPYLTFTLLADRTGPVEFIWRGDGGLDHAEVAELKVTA